MNINPGSAPNNMNFNNSQPSGSGNTVFPNPVGGGNAGQGWPGTANPGQGGANLNIPNMPNIPQGMNPNTFAQALAAMQRQKAFLRR